MHFSDAKAVRPGQPEVVNRLSGARRPHHVAPLRRRCNRPAQGQGPCILGYLARGAARAMDLLTSESLSHDH